jgi:hypothetical protein
MHLKRAKDEQHLAYKNTANAEEVQSKKILTIDGKGSFEVLEDLGEKLLVRRQGSNNRRFIVRKERFNCST